MNRDSSKKVLRKWLVDYAKKSTAFDIDPAHPLNSPELRDRAVKRALKREEWKKEAKRLERERHWWRKGS